jgi:hypothetical protein
VFHIAFGLVCVAQCRELRRELCLSPARAVTTPTSKNEDPRRGHEVDERPGSAPHPTSPEHFFKVTLWTRIVLPPRMTHWQTFPITGKNCAFFFIGQFFWIRVREKLFAFRHVRVVRFRPWENDVAY